MEFGIIEIGSTNTKAFIYKNGILNDFGQKYIAFKNNYTNRLLENDINDLYDFIKEIKKTVNNIYAFGTSIFRKISEEERNEFTKALKNKFDVEFRVVSAEEEAIYTVKGVINNIDYTNKLAVVIGGGGSTELIITENKKITNKILLDFGAMDITNSFPDLKNDITNTNFDIMLNYTLNKIGDININIDVLVLAGGDYIYFYQNADYEMENNYLYRDKNQPYLLTFEKLDFYDHDILTKSLKNIKEKCKGNESWWDGARGMRLCMNAIARKLNSKYIIPTKINMLIALAEEIKNNNTSQNNI